MLRTTRNLVASLAVFAAFPSGALASGDCDPGDFGFESAKVHGEYICGGGSGCASILPTADGGSCFAWTCDDITQGLGIAC